MIISGSGLLSGYAVFRGWEERMIQCWYDRTPPFARIRPVLAILVRSWRVISVIAYRRLGMDVMQVE